MEHGQIHSMDRLDGLSFCPAMLAELGLVSLHFDNAGIPHELTIPVPLAIRLLDSLQLLVYEHALRK
ncbi:hypothetical protein [Cupriavidus taiwanensis]|uniref:hypothetical protein n=1 Tax=Cupriavidus taiwanensis TaxID=164546 RepID=UPI0011C12EA7|nr:hypothetical protein [Cupriavidus taiwanensis]